MVIIFLSWLSLSWAANHYVDKNANGNNNGTSWSNAWENLSDIEWNQIQPGDIIYISGGTDSTVYYEHLLVQASGTAANHITIRNSYDIGHNGRVILDGEDFTGYGIRVGTNSSNNPDYIYIKGLEVRNYKLGIHLNWAVEVITLDSLIISGNHGRAINVQGDDCVTVGCMTDSITIKNCNITTPVDVNAECDGIYLKYVSNAVVHDNYIHIANASDVNRHSDGIQTNPVKGFKLYNNVIICDSNTFGIAYIAGAISVDGVNDSVIIYNNYMYGGGIWRNGAEPWVTVLNPEFAQRWATLFGMVAAPHFIAHNTIVAQGPWTAGCHIVAPSTMVNNIIVQFEGSPDHTPPANGFDYVNGYLWLETFRNTSVPDVVSVKNNLMWTEWSIGKFRGGPFAGVKAYSWADWVGTGGTGVNGNPLFIDQIGYVGDQGTLDGELQLSSPAINAGEDIQWLIESMGLPWTDINGNARDNTPTIGAYEYDVRTAVEDPGSNGLPNEFSLHQNYPNPFNPTTTIKYQIPELSFVTIKVYDVLGNEVATLVNAKKPEGNYEVKFDAVSLPSGIYFYRLQAGSFVETKKMVLMK